MRASSDAAILRPVAAIVPPGSVASAVASYDAREDRAVVRGIADMVIVLKNGLVVAEGAPADVLGERSPPH